MRISDWSSDVCSSDLVFVLEVRDGFEDGESLGGQGRDKQAVTDLGGQSQAGRGACAEARASPRGAARGAEHTAPNSADAECGKCEPPPQPPPSRGENAPHPPTDVSCSTKPHDP